MDAIEKDTFIFLVSGGCLQCGRIGKTKIRRFFEATFFAIFKKLFCYLKGKHNKFYKYVNNYKLYREFIELFLN